MTAPAPLPSPEGRAGAYTGALLVALVSGALIALQSRTNGELGRELGDGFVAALWSFGSGWTLVAIALALSRRGRAGFRAIPGLLRRGELRWFYLLGGCCGALLVLAQSLTVAVIGVALFSIAVIAGQTLSGIVIDTRGIGRVAAVRLTPRRIVGAVVVVVAVGVSIAPRIAGDIPVVVLAFPFLIGLAVGWQQAVNGQVRTATGSPLTATFVNFAAGTALLSVVTTVHLVVSGLPDPVAPNPLFLTGGIIGALFITGFAIAVPVVGVLVQTLAAVLGQLATALLLGLVAHDPSAPVDAFTVAGAVLTLAGVLVVSVRRPGRASGRLAG